MVCPFDLSYDDPMSDEDPEIDADAENMTVR